MPEPSVDLRATKAWKALEADYARVQALHLRDLFAADPKRGERMTLEAAGIYPRLFEESRHRMKPCAAPATCGRVGSARAHRRHVQRREDQHHGKSRGAARSACARPSAMLPSWWTAKMSCREVHAVLDKMSAFADTRAQRRMEGLHRQAHSQRHQHRHRRLRSRPGDGLRSSETLQRCAK